jgi:hypothetical protein
MILIESSPDKSGAFIVPCAVIYAGDLLAVAIEARSGRHPVQIGPKNDSITWICSDGVAEKLDLGGATGREDFLRIQQEIDSEGLLVTEVCDLAAPVFETNSHWILSKNQSTEQRERQA